MAKSKCIYFVGLIGKVGDKLRYHMDLLIFVDHKRTARIKEIHILINSIIWQFVEEKLCIS